jgi:hypothetical protein
MQMIMSMHRARVRTRGGKKAFGIFRAQKGALRKKGVSYVIWSRVVKSQPHEGLSNRHTRCTPSPENSEE